MNDVDRLEGVHPELRASAAALPAPVAADLATMRAGARPATRALPPPAPQQVERTIPGPPDNPVLNVAIIDPGRGARGRGAFLHFHGGGFIRGSADGQPDFLQELAMAARCLVVSVDYRLAPEGRFPAAREDGYATLAWLHAEAASLGIDRDRIAIGGTSAGAGHAAALALAVRDRGDYRVALQLLIQPMLDDRTGSSVNPAPGSGRLLWTVAHNRVGWAALLGQEAGGAIVPTGAVPAREADLAGLAPAWIGVGSLDLFAREDAAYAASLEEAGVPVTFVEVPGAFHGFDRLVPDASVSRRFANDYYAALRGALT